MRSRWGVRDRAGRYELRAVVLLPDGTEAGPAARPLELLPKP